MLMAEPGLREITKGQKLLKIKKDREFAKSHDRQRPKRTRQIQEDECNEQGGIRSFLADCSIRDAEHYTSISAYKISMPD